MHLDWDILSDQDFEELCYDLLDKEGFVNIKWMGRGGNDRGRDARAPEKSRNNLENQKENELASCFKLVLNKELYVVSCKGSSEKKSGGK